MNDYVKRVDSHARYLVPTAMGIVIGASLRMLGTPLMVLFLAAGAVSAYAFGWRVTITRSNDRIIDR